MLRKLLAALFAATLMTGGAWGVDNPMLGVDASGGADTNSTTDDISAGSGIGTLVEVDTSGAAIAAGVGDAKTAVYSIDDTHTLQIGVSTGGASTLTITGGAGDPGNTAGGIAAMYAAAGTGKLDILAGGVMTLQAGEWDTDKKGGQANVGFLAGSTLKNSGTINVYNDGSTTSANSERSSLVFADGAEYNGQSTGTINLEGDLILGTTIDTTTGAIDTPATGTALSSADNVTALNIDTLLGSVNLESTGAIGIHLADTIGLGAGTLSLKSVVADSTTGNTGKLTITGYGDLTVDKNIDLKGEHATGAHLVIDAAGTSKSVIMTGNITARTITAAMTGTTSTYKFTGAVNGDFIADGGNVTFDGATASLTGGLKIETANAIAFDNGATATIGTGKALDFNGVDGTLTIDNGSALNLASGAKYIVGGGSEAITVDNGSTINIDANITDNAGTPANVFDAIAGLITLTGTDDVLNVANAGATPVDVAGLDLAGAGDGSIVNLSMNSKAITGAVDVTDAVLNIKQDVTFKGAVAAATAATADVGLKVESGVKAAFGDGVGSDAVAIGAGVELGANSKTTFTDTLGVGGDLASLTGATAEFGGAVTLAAGKAITLAKDAKNTFTGTANVADTITAAAGSTIAAQGGPVAFAPTADNTGKFEIARGATLDAGAGSITIGGGAAKYAEAKINGKMIIGATGPNANTISTVNTTAADFTNATIELTAAAANAIVADPAGFVTNNLLIDANGGAATTGLSNETLNNMFGQFNIVYDADTTSPTYGKLYVASVANKLAQDGQDDDRNTNLSNLQTAWNGAEIDRSLADAVYDSRIPAAAPLLSLAPEAATEDNVFGVIGGGQLTLDLLKAMGGTPDATSYTEGVGKSLFRSGDVSEMMNAGVGEIRGINSAIGARNVQLRGQMAGASSVSYEYANPSLLLNNDYANRVWAGYIGQWEKGDSRNSVSGYDYNSNGFIVGYDRLVGCNFAFGGAFAYSRGDYEDKAALSNSSKIDNYSFNGYATYSALNGVFASLFGGYTHQKNDIGATYQGLGTVIAKSADYDADFWHIGGQVGYDFQPVDGLVLTPSIGLQYVHGRADSHFSRWSNATGVGGGYVNSATQKSLLLPIEIAARYNIDFSNCSRLAIEGNIGYSYNFMDDNATAGMMLANVVSGGSEPVFINGYDRDASRHTFNAGAGLRYTYNRFDIGLKYDYYLQQDAHAHRLMGTVGVSF